MRYALVNLGCKVNRVESDGFERLLRSRGHVPSAQADADLVVVNTCTVTGEAEKKTRKAVRHALREAARATVVVTGCAAAIDEEAFASLDERVQVVPKAAMNLFLENIATQRQTEADRRAAGGAARIGPPPPPPAAAAEGMRDEGADAALFSSRTRVGVKVQDGCDNACTYCIVHVARGAATSRAYDKVEAEVVSLARQGVREVVLSGINIGSYDDGGLKLAGMLERLLEKTDGLCGQDEHPPRFRVSSIEPKDVDDDFISLMARAEGRVCRHVHLPLQSGSSKVLADMARPYDAAGYLDLVRRLKEAVPQIALTTDVIVGFPGETDGDFAETCRVARACGFSKMHVFPYSMRAGTPAASRPDQVPAAVKTARARELRALSASLRQLDLAARAGTCELALVEEGGRAMSESYHEVVVSAAAPLGALVPVVFP